MIPHAFVYGLMGADDLIGPQSQRVKNWWENRGKGERQPGTVKGIRGQAGQLYHAGRSMFSLPHSRSSIYSHARAQGYDKDAAEQFVLRSNREFVKRAAFSGAAGASYRLPPIPGAIENPTAVGKIYNFFTRSPKAHIANSWAPAWDMAKGGLRDFTGVAFAQGSYYKMRSTMQKKGTWGKRYSTLRYQGFTHLSAVEKLKSQAPIDLSDMRPASWKAPITKSLFRQGYFFGGLAATAAVNESFNNPHGPIYGAAVTIPTYAMFAPGMRMGWGFGAAAGRATAGMAVRGAGLAAGGRVALGVGRLALGAGTIGGALTGALTAGVVIPMLFEEAMNGLPGVGFRLKRRGFGNLYGPYKDNPVVATMRQQALSAMSQSQMNARNALGGEAALLHLT